LKLKKKAIDPLVCISTFGSKLYKLVGTKIPALKSLVWFDIARLAEKQKIPALKSLVWFDRGSNRRYTIICTSLFL
jgi:cephalosporin-C deacetylase-like acetyl esterase